MNSITIEKLIKDLKLEVIHKSKQLDIEITRSELNRPGLQLTGYLEHFAYERLQILGNVEWNYLSTLPDNIKEERLEEIFKRPIPALVITRGLEVIQPILKLAQKYDRTILRTCLPTTKFINGVINYLSEMLAPSITTHGVLVEIYGIGILILGKSGVGKSEAALELIKRGHRLIADDAVQISKVEEGRLKGRAPELIRHYLEIRGIGILDIERLYGVGSVRDAKTIELVAQLEYWDDNKEYDRVGLEEEYTEILKTKLPRVAIPVKPGRNIAMILEVAAKNHRQKQMGYNAAEELDKRLTMQIDSE